MHTVELQAIIKFALGKATEGRSVKRQSIVNKKTCSVCNYYHYYYLQRVISLNRSLNNVIGFLFHFVPL